MTYFHRHRALLPLRLNRSRVSLFMYTQEKESNWRTSYCSRPYAGVPARRSFPSLQDLPASLPRESRKTDLLQLSRRSTYARIRERLWSPESRVVCAQSLKRHVAVRGERRWWSERCVELQLRRFRAVQAPVLVERVRHRKVLHAEGDDGASDADPDHQLPQRRQRGREGGADLGAKGFRPAQGQWSGLYACKTF